MRLSSSGEVTVLVCAVRGLTRVPFGRDVLRVEAHHDAAHAEPREPAEPLIDARVAAAQRVAVALDNRDRELGGPPLVRGDGS